MIDVHVVPTGPLLAPIFAALHLHAFAQPWSTDALTATLARPDTVTVVATAATNPSEEAPPVGFVIARLAGPEAEILTLAVDPAHRRRGIGRRLVTALFEAARAAGATELLLEVESTNNAAQALYAAAGFEADGRRPGYYRAANGQRHDALLMRAAVSEYNNT
ncbi:MAG: GNAT family N-acetyltransferase [Pseudomonadota bacterium]|nr:GNAT family N-acetyltransferase [Pseudomonadota bacterium]